VALEHRAQPVLLRLAGSTQRDGLNEDDVVGRPPSGELTDADAVYQDWGQPTQRAIRRAAPEALSAMSFAAGTMGPKVQAACRFARLTGKRAAIGELSQLSQILAGEAGTTVDPAVSGIVYAR
jgi:carbamate kinase